MPTPPLPHFKKNNKNKKKFKNKNVLVLKHRKKVDKRKSQERESNESNIPLKSNQLFIPTLFTLHSSLLTDFVALSMALFSRHSRFPQIYFFKNFKNNNDSYKVAVTIAVFSVSVCNPNRKGPKFKPFFLPINHQFWWVVGHKPGMLSAISLWWFCDVVCCWCMVVMVVPHLAPFDGDRMVWRGWNFKKYVVNIFPRV